MADENDPARKYHAYLEDWLKRDDEQRALRPTVERMLGTAVWQVGAMDAVRSASPSMALEMDSEIDRDLADLKTKMPLPAQYKPLTDVSSSAIGAAGNARVFEGLVALRLDGGQPSPLNTHITAYERLVADQGRADEAGRRVNILFAHLFERFNAARDAVQLAGADPLVQEGAAMHMRTFLYKLNGELFERARSRPGENMTWELMVMRLASADGIRLLRDQEETNSALLNMLSNIGKGRSSAFTLSEAWTRFVDHVFVVCGEVIAGTHSGYDGTP